MTSVPLSLLDLAIVAQGATSTEALEATITVAQRADELGYHRFWVAEHHNMGSVASTSPAVLMSAIAARTDQIHVGSGGVMLPNHSPLVIAEQFALVEALHPGRVDLGIGRAPGTDQATAAALRRQPDGIGAEDFPQDLINLMGLLGDPRSERGMWDQLIATPEATTFPTIVLLGSSGFSAQLAGMLGLPFGYAHHFDMGGPTQAAFDLYRDSFEPSAVLSEPHVLVTATGLAAETSEQAHYLAAPGQLRKYGMRTGRSIPMLSPEAAATHPAFDAAHAMPTNRIVGTTDELVEGLNQLVTSMGADELMLSIASVDLDARLWCTDALAERWGLDRKAS